MKAKKNLVIYGAALIIVVSSLVNAGEENGNQVLKRVDDTMNAPKDKTATMMMIIIEDDGSEKTRELRMIQKGDEKRMIKFLSPAEVKGVGFLSLTDDRMYLYMPAFRKIRRIASHVKNENFMGTDFSYNDMGQTTYTDDYTAIIKERREDRITLELSPRDPNEVDYSRLVMEVNPSNYMINKIEFFDKRGRMWKIMEQKEIEKVGQYWTPKSIEMRDILKKHSTKMEMGDINFDNGLDDNLFSKRNLKKRPR